MPPPDATSPLDAARERLGTVATRLGAFLAGSEEVFLDAGARLAGLERRARALVEVSQGALARGAAGADGDPVERLDRSLDGLERYLGAGDAGAESGLHGLAAILAGAGAIAGLRGDCGDLARTLRVVGMYARIENSREGLRSVGMESVVAEVRRLGDVIEARFTGVFALAASVAATAGAASARAAGYAARRRAWSKQLGEETRRAVGSLRALAASQAAVAGSAVTASEELVRAVTDVLVALQVHDTTRQVIEHVVEELAAFERDARAAAAAGPLDGGAWHAEVRDVCGVLAAQLAGARAALGSALDGIAKSFRGMARRVTDVAAETDRLAGEGEGPSPVACAERGLAQAMAALREHLANDREMSAARAAVADDARRIASHLGDMRGIGAAVKIIALNALVETERTGAGGRVLAILAERIAALAAELVQRTGAVSRTLEAIEAEARALASDEATRHLAEGAALAADLEPLAPLLRGYHAGVRGGAAALRDGSRDLRDEVDALARRLAEESAAAGALAQLEAELRRVAADAGALAPPPGAERPRVRQSRALDRYTMASEREIHARALRDGEPAPATPAEPIPHPELGDNVELF